MLANKVKNMNSLKRSMNDSSNISRKFNRFKSK